jgi:MFS family permease
MSPLRWMPSLCVVSVLWAFSFGVNAPLASVWMSKAGYTEAPVGDSTSIYYLGIAVAATAVPWAMRRFGYAALLVGLVGSGLTAAAFPWGGGLAGWYVLRALNGIAAAVSLIPLETYVNRTSAPEARATNFGVYAFCIALGMALGNVVAMQMAESAPRQAFLLGGATPLLSSVIVLRWRPVFTDEAEDMDKTLPIGFIRNSLSFGSGWAQGFMEGGMVALLPIYLGSVGMSTETVGWLMGGLMIGVILAQGPVAWLADRFGRTALLAACNLVALVGIGCLVWSGGVVWLAGWLFVVGACSGALYPLGLALLGERTPPAGMARAGAWFLGINCLGSIVGPIIAGRAMERFGGAALFLAGGAAIVGVLGVWVTARALPSLARRANSSPAAESHSRDIPLPAPRQAA